MLQIGTIFDSKQKKQVEGELVNRILLALDQYEINLQQMKEISSYILEHIDNVKDSEHLIIFLNQLGEKWGLFKEIYMIYKNKVTEQKEKQILRTLSQLVKNGKPN